MPFLTESVPEMGQAGKWQYTPKWGSGRAERVGVGHSVVEGHLTLSPVCNCEGGAPLIPWSAEAYSQAGSQIHRWLGSS